MNKRDRAQQVIRVILIGDCRVGKTSLLNRIILKDGNSSNHYPPTIGVQYATTVMRMPVSGKQLKVQIWDTSGAEKYQSITSSYYRKSQGAFLVFDVTQRQSFQNIVKWLASVRSYGDKNIAIFLVANKIDLVESGAKSRTVSEQQISDFCLKHDLGFRQTSALTGYNVQELFQDILEKICETAFKGEEYDYSELTKISFTSDQTNKKKNDTVMLQEIKEEEQSKCFKCC